MVYGVDNGGIDKSPFSLDVGLYQALSHFQSVGAGHWGEVDFLTLEYGSQMGRHIDGCHLVGRQMDSSSAQCHHSNTFTEVWGLDELHHHLAILGLMAKVALTVWGCRVYSGTRVLSFNHLLDNIVPYYRSLCHTGLGDILVSTE